MAHPRWRAGPGSSKSGPSGSRTRAWCQSPHPRCGTASQTGRSCPCQQRPGGSVQQRKSVKKKRWSTKVSRRAMQNISWVPFRLAHCT